ncbi:tyrosine-protein phosphatase [Micromonospora humi]|uniref:Tyrosine phosphatase family protein n=1 Tax=Micromonospora humi TaxID=745366 RepID=A0A1C5GV63_9ACTN|nr:tyrosine-protein phosphatase [Micromonospora humi]SCG37658.1 Tyrosine phosphatase family protein [Micromonospora humi]
MTAPARFSTLCNVRDLGGRRTGDGRTVARGRLYRSDSLAKLAGDDLARFAALGVRTVIDLRYRRGARLGGRLRHRAARGARGHRRRAARPAPHRRGKPHDDDGALWQAR